MTIIHQDPESLGPSEKTVAIVNASEEKKCRLPLWFWAVAVVLTLVLGVGLGVGLSGSGSSKDTGAPSTTIKDSESIAISELFPAQSSSNELFIQIGCFTVEDSFDVHALSRNTAERASACSNVCFTPFFGIVPEDNTCRCLVSIPPENRLAIGGCATLDADSVSVASLMEVYFNQEASEECAQENTKTVRNFLVQEDDVKFGFDIVSNTFRASPFELFNDECGTNIYEVQTEVSENSLQVETSMSDIRSFAESRRSERSSSLSFAAEVGYKGLFASASASVSAARDTEQTNLFKSSGASEQNGRVFTSVGVKRLAEVKIQDFDNSNQFVTLSPQFGNLLRKYLRSDFDKDVAFGIIRQYGQFVLTRGIFGGYAELRTTMSDSDFSSSFSSEERAKECYEASVSVEASGFGFRAKASSSSSGCSEEELAVMNASRRQFGEDVKEQSVVGGRSDGDTFIVTPADATLLTTIDKYPTGDKDGVQFRLMSDFLSSSKISPLEVKRLQITELQFDSIQESLQDHILEYLQDVASEIGGCNCTSTALPYLEEDPQGKQVCRCYDPLAPEIEITLPISNTFSKRGNRRVCAWNKCPADRFYWVRQLGDDCGCSNGFNTCYMDGPDVDVATFEEINLVPVESATGQALKWKLEAFDEETGLYLGQGHDTASGGSCFDDPLRGGFNVDLTGTDYEMAQGSQITLSGWSPYMRVMADGQTVATVGSNAAGATHVVKVPEGTKLLEVNCGGWGGGCSSEFFVSKM